MPLKDLTIKSDGSGAHVVTETLTNGKVFSWTFPVRFFHAEADLTAAFTRSMKDVIDYYEAQLPAKGGDVVGGLLT